MNITLGAEPTAGEKAKSLFNLWRISITPNSPVAKELMQDPKMSAIIKSYRIGTGALVGAIFLFAVLKKRKKKKKKLSITPPKAIT